MGLKTRSIKIVLNFEVELWQIGSAKSLCPLYSVCIMPTVYGSIGRRSTTVLQIYVQIDVYGNGHFCKSIWLKKGAKFVNIIQSSGLIRTYVLSNSMFNTAVFL